MHYDFIANTELMGMNILILLLLFRFNLRNWKPNFINPLSVIYLLVFTGCICEIFAFYADGRPHLIWLNYLSNIIYFASVGMMAATMLEHCSTVFPRPIWKNHLQHVLFMIPVDIELICLLLAPKFGLIFYIAEDGTYQRSSTFFLQMIPYLYLIVTTVMGVYWLMKSQTTRERNAYLAIALFAVPPFLLGGLQLVVKAPLLDALEFSVILSLIANYAVTQNNKITRDTLTKLPNREVLDTVLMEKMRDRRKEEKPEKLYVMMGDLDGFKKINDNYGHLEGDQALIIAADTLYHVTGRYKGMAARFGGDEFAIVCEFAEEELAQRMIHEIEEALVENSKDQKFTLRMSIGYTVYEPDDMIFDILKKADAELYRVKKVRGGSR